MPGLFRAKLAFERCKDEVAQQGHPSHITDGTTEISTRVHPGATRGQGIGGHRIETPAATTLLAKFMRGHR